jgi:hypothetical protein
MIYNSAVRAYLILLASTGCSQIFGIEAPQRLDGAVADTAQDDAPADVAARVTATFQNGVGGYISARDTWIDSGAPNLSHDRDSPLRIRDPDRWSMLAFADIFGDAAGQIPPTATIESAHLEVYLANNNCEASVAQILVPWVATVTYNTFGPTPGAQMTEDFSSPFAVLPTAMLGKISLDVTTSLTAWQTAPQSNNGWLFVPTGGLTDCTVRSSDENQPLMRPLLSVTYVP